MSPECIAIPAPKRFREDKIVDEYNNHTMLIPSKVVHITNVSPSTTEAHFIKAFNEVAYVILMPLKEMALVEFECIQAANTCISETLSKAIIVKGQQLRISYSKYQFLKRFGLESEIPSNRPMQSYRGNSCHRGNNNIRKYESPADIERKNNDHALPNKYNSDRSNNNQDNSRLRYVCHDLTYPSHAVKHDMYAEERKHKRARIKSPYGKRADSKIDYQRKKDRMDNESSRGGYPNTFSDRNNRKRHRNDSYNKKPVSKNDSRHDDIEFDNKKGKNGTCNSRFNEDRHKSLVESKVIVIYGVNQTDFNCDKLFNLFCPYGNVLRVKFLITRANMCMVEMECHSALKNVIRYLYNVKIMGTTLTFMKSKEHYFDDLNEPGHSFNLFDGSPSFKDFSDNKQLLRFNTPEMAIRNRLAYPSAEIRWFSVLCDISDEQIVEAFKDAKAPKPLSIKRNCNGHGRCMSGFIKFKNAEEAAEALATANNVYIYCSHPKSDIMLRMAFCDTSTPTTCRAIKRELQPDKSNSFNFKTD
uniref:RRM domain-containing protein n=1 Tax=Rhabditophanes sp. KR3021 TaxID=114890 RepID=A0AC35TUU2_9BILA